AGELAHHLDDADLLVGRVFLQRDAELGLLLGRRGGGSTGGRGGSHGNVGGGGDAELLLQVGDQLDDFQDAQVGNRVDNFFTSNGHFSSPENSVSGIGRTVSGSARRLLLVADRDHGADELERCGLQGADELLHGGLHDSQ